LNLIWDAMHKPKEEDSLNANSKDKNHKTKEIEKKKEHDDSHPKKNDEEICYI